MRTLRLRLLGAPLAVDVTDADHERLTAQWSRCLDTAGTAPEGPRLSHRPPEEQDTADADYLLASTLTLAAIEQRAGELLMLHACGVADSSGRTAVLVGPSGTGKTTAAAALSSHGFGYVTDETVAMSSDGRVTAYPKPLSVVADPPLSGKIQHGPDRLGFAAPPVECTVGLIGILDRVPDQGAEVRVMPPIDALLAIIPQTSALPRLPDPLWTLARIALGCGGFRHIRYAEADQLVELIGRELRPRQQGRPDRLTHLPPAPADRRPPDAGTVPGTHPALLPQVVLRRTPYTDAVADRMDLLILLGDQPVRVQGSAATVWLALQRPMRLPELVAACVRAHGEHPEAAALVRQAAQCLLADGLIRTCSTPTGTS